jgi:hypothetical protein
MELALATAGQKAAEYAGNRVQQYINERIGRPNVTPDTLGSTTPSTRFTELGDSLPRGVPPPASDLPPSFIRPGVDTSLPPRPVMENSGFTEFSEGSTRITPSMFGGESPFSRPTSQSSTATTDLGFATPQGTESRSLASEPPRAVGDGERSLTRVTEQRIPAEEEAPADRIFGDQLRSAESNLAVERDNRIIRNYGDLVNQRARGGIGILNPKAPSPNEVALRNSAQEAREYLNRIGFRRAQRERFQRQTEPEGVEMTGGAERPLPRPALSRSAAEHIGRIDRGEVESYGGRIGQPRMLEPSGSEMASVRVPSTVSTNMSDFGTFTGGRLPNSLADETGLSQTLPEEGFGAAAEGGAAEAGAAEAGIGATLGEIGEIAAII